MCPTAYHLKCLPLDTKAIRLTKKYIICGKHNADPSEYAAYDDNNNASGANNNQWDKKRDLKYFGKSNASEEDPDAQGNRSSINSHWATNDV